jgi:hypothetical protein
VGSRQSLLYRGSAAFLRRHAVPDTRSRAFLDTHPNPLTPRHCHPQGLALTPARTTPHCQSREQGVAHTALRQAQGTRSDSGHSTPEFRKLFAAELDPGMTQLRGHPSSA